MAYLKAVYWIAYFTTGGTNWQFFFTSLICLEQEMSLKSNYIVVSYSTTNVTNCLVCFTSLFSILHEINKDSENIMARIIFHSYLTKNYVGLFCSVKKEGVAWHLFLCFPLVTRSWFMGYSVAGTYLEFCTNDAGTREFLVTGFRRGILLFPLLKIFNVNMELSLQKKKYTNKGNRTIADLRYGQEDSFSPSTLIFAAIKN